VFRLRSFVIVALIAVAVAVIYDYWYSGGYVKSAPDRALLPTINALLRAPQPTPGFVTKIDPPVGSTIQQGSTFCVTVSSAAFLENPTSADIDARAKLIESTYRVIINGQRTAKNNTLGLGTMSGSGAFTILNPMCATPRLDPGPQLLEIEIFDTWLGNFGFGTAHRYQWAYTVSR